MIFGVLFALLVTTAPVAQRLGGPPMACDAARLSVVDFLRGRWHVRSHEPARSPPRERTGVATVSSIAGRCALQEDLRLGEDYEEVRILAFDHRTGTWQLVVLDSEHGNAVVLGGHSITDGLEFVTTHQRAEGLLVDRVSLRRTREGWVMRTETAVGYGAPWRLLQEIAYTRRP